MAGSAENRFTDEQLLRAALARGLAWGAREVRLGDQGVAVTDALGNRRDLTRHGQKVKADAEVLKDLLGDSRFLNWQSWKHSANERVIDGLGVWIESPGDGEVVLKPKKPRAPCVDAMVRPDGDGLARLRSLYRRGGIDVFVFCEGDTRARDLALAISSERKMLGLPTAVDLAVEQPGYRREASREGQYGPPVFDDEGSEAGEAWAVTQVPAENMSGLFMGNDDPEGSRVFVASSNRHEVWRFMRAQAQLDARERPAVLVAVGLEKSTPVLRAIFQKGLQQESTPEAVFRDAPWAVFAERKAAREKSRKPAPKTWHPTSEAVAEAFVAREAPRGYVSGKNLYFHGPVAFSCYDRNPVAAIVDLPGKRTAVFIGRDDGIGGTMAGTVSMAQNDVVLAARAKGYLVFHVDRLTDFLTLGGRQLDELAPVMRNRKNEAEYPAACRVDRRKLKSWFLLKRSGAMDEVEAAFRTGFATYRRADSYRALQHLASKRDRLAGLLEVDLPEIGSAEEFRVWADAEREAADRRQAELAERRLGLQGRDDEVPGNQDDGEVPAPAM